MSATRTDPVVVIGMHRSGTSMIIRMLRRMGVFTGWELDANGEAIFFVLRNRAILEAQGARWDRPDPIDALLEHGSLRRRLAETLRRQLSTPSVASYLGPVRYLRHGSPFRLDRPWGWKDPRNTLLLGLWLDIFPGARVINVVRNGIDVALSLARRERSRVEHVVGDGQRASGFLRLVTRPPEDCGAIPWAFSQVRLRLGGGQLRRRFTRLRIHPCIDPVRGFELWEQYVARAEGQAESVRNGILRVRYEDVLRDPRGESRRLATFCGLDVERARLEQAAALVDTSRASGFASESARTTLGEDAQSSRWLQQLGYGRSGEEPA